jgi:hypothetical protein
VWAWVQNSNGSGYSAGRISADSLGNYRADFLPGATILLEAVGSGTEQPCAATVPLTNSNATLDFELESSDDPLPDLHTTPPVLTGIVYEQTAQGKVPIRGAKLWYSPIMDLTGATTTTDNDGRYALCRLPVFFKLQDLYVTATGYQVLDTAVSITSDVTHFDVSLKR